MSEEINRVKVFQDVVDEWWLEFYANDVRHQVTIQDVINGLASWVNMQVTNAVLHERIDDLESAQQGMHPTNGGLVLRACGNAHCGWVGKESACLTWKHAGDERFCPHCNEVTESIPLSDISG